MLKGVQDVIYEDAFASEEGFKAVSISKDIEICGDCNDLLLKT